MLLSIEDLRVSVPGARGAVRVVDGVGLTLERGQSMALVGESGCGKSLTALSLLGLLDAGVCASVGRYQFDGRVVAEGRVLDGPTLRRLRGRRIGMVFQEPMSSLNPVLRVGEQIGEVLGLRGLRGRAARVRAAALLEEVGIVDAGARLRAFPHELSGGMQQRVLIAMALAGEPALLIADEPTTALDVTVESQILRLLAELRQRRQMGLLLISHDLNVVGRCADDIAVMYAGRIVERGPASGVLARPRHPYTQGLVRCTPRLTGVVGRRLPTIPGEVPRVGARPAGCAFHPRCEVGRDEAKCREVVPVMEEVEAGWSCACWWVRGDVVDKSGLPREIDARDAPASRHGGHAE